ncbi:polar amino acid transport system substrate-binding protein [Paucibacter oligotrophus]|uniref:Polar amino acid transport system substrate-binding protein n=1 Tax=Roseateles oligotrophus TaxID=1769250 RepID=A0A840L9W1_9BURK|nr:transporter substrate-binding domain-containing protein [Roseateles oligotrophus]MBB4843462.1 polar amino acid transport system substrate-binding protein [Roseateles oligotrophus]
MANSQTTRRLLLTLGLLSGLALPGLASAQTLARVAKTGQINLGFIDDVAPMSSRNSQGQVQGYGAELCQPIAAAVKAKLNLATLNVHFVAVNAEEAIARIATGNIDLLCTATAETLKRREQLSYSIPVLNGGVGVLIRRDAPRALSEFLQGKVAATGPLWRGSLNGGRTHYTYAVRDASLAEEWAKAQTRRLGATVRTVLVNEDAKGVQLLRSKQADAFVGERVLLEQYLSRNKLDGELLLVKRSFNTELLALALARNDDDFRLLVDGTLSKLYQSPEFPALYARYFGPMDAATQALFQGWVRP